MIADVQDPPGFAYYCPLCPGKKMHFVGKWHCYNCGSDFTLDDLEEIWESEEFQEEGGDWL